MSNNQPFIEWVDEKDASGKVKEIYDSWFANNPGRDAMPGIMKCLSSNPDFLESVIGFCYPLQFQDGQLTRRQKEMISTYVSAINRCEY